MKPFKDYFAENGGGSGAGGIGGGSGSAPTNVQAGLGSVVSPTGERVTPPVFRNAQKKRQKKGKESEKKLVKSLSSLRRMLP